ncbi:uncharacterized protein LOC115881143 [Sitophilus oryzae]|uniref:Uncharacterized protein LOC115881143 n=1 Tax=Sitophilus oryzae TaxID=7048 RepID=A0A6J2XS99_SITOR|nr:uncharacterized protein LOC115881143 [Sitophilus oryzae]
MVGSINTKPNFKMQSESSNASDLSSNGTVLDLNRPQSQSATHATGNTLPQSQTATLDNDGIGRNVPRPRRGTSPLAPQGGRRIKWTNEMNEFVIEHYFLITKCERIKVAYRKKLHEAFQTEYPQLNHMTEQNIADRRSGGLVWFGGALLEAETLNNICQKVERRLRQTEESQETHDIQRLDTNELEETEEARIMFNRENDESSQEGIHPEEREQEQKTNQINGTEMQSSKEFPLAEILTHEFKEAKTRWEGIPLENRIGIPKQNSKKLAELIVIFNSIILPEQLKNLTTLEEIQNILYLGALSICKCNGAKILEEYISNHQKATHRWQGRLERQISDLK